MNTQKLIKDIKSEIPPTLMMQDYEMLDSLYIILSWVEEYPDDIVRTFATSYFKMMYGEPYEDGNWLERVYDIIDGGLIKP